MIYAQSYKIDEALKSEISKLAFLDGNWEGTGWMMSRDGKKHEFNQTENIQFKLDTTLLLIECQWYESGEYYREEKWVQFFEMTLDKRN